LAAWFRKDGDALAPLRVLLVLSIAGPALIFAAGAWYTRHETFRNAAQDLARLSDVAREHAQKVFDTHRLIADQVNNLLRGMDNAAILRSEAALHRALADMIAGLPQAESILVTDGTGKPLVSADVYPLPNDVSLSDRDYVAAIREGSARTFVSQVYPRRLTTGAFFGLAYRRTDPQGGFTGVINVLVAPSLFTQFYRTLIGGTDTGQDATVLTLVRQDGAVLARYPMAGGKPAHLTPDSPFFDAISRSPQAGIYAGLSTVDPVGIQRHYSYRLVEGHGLYVISGRSVASIYGAWLRELGGYLAFGVPAMLALFAITLTALRRTRREQEALVQARQEMERRERAETALSQAQKLEAVGQLTAGVAHDFNNLLTVILGNLEFLALISANDPRALRRIAPMRAAAERGARLTGQLLAFSSRHPLSPQSIDLNAVVASMGEMLQSTLGGTLQIVTALGPGLWTAMADRTQLELALLNLAINARDSMKSDGVLTIETANASLAEPKRPEDPPAGDYVAVSVGDTGSGMSPETLARAFEPFFTTKPVGEGSGLGLSQVYGFARQSRGGISIRSTPGIGTSVTLYLPRSTAAEREAWSTETAEQSAHGGATILVVDDEEDVRGITTAMLADLGHTALEASGGNPALQILSARPDINLAVIDFAMPGMNGIELARRLRQSHATLPVLFLTGYAETSALAARDSGDLLLQKPFTARELAARIGALLSGHSAARARIEPRNG
jgi:two-component system NtrC family sensor kinase